MGSIRWYRGMKIKGTHLGVRKRNIEQEKIGEMAPAECEIKDQRLAEGTTELHPYGLK